MKQIRLIQPNTALESEYIETLNEWLQTGEKLVPFVLQIDSGNFKSYIKQLKEFSKGINIDPEFVSHSTYWLVDSKNKIIGVSNIRHELTKRLLKDGGHIGYGIRPSERRKGYATLILKLSLKKAAEMGIRKVLITCDKNNTGSSKSIKKNGGILWKEHKYNNRVTQNFWIEN